jgi:hypothetical protein
LSVESHHHVDGCVQIGDEHAIADTEKRLDSNSTMFIY